MYNREKILQTLRDIEQEAKLIKPYVVIAQPRRDLNEKPAQLLDGYHGLHVDLSGFSHGFCNIGGEAVDVARNYLIEQVINSEAKYLFFVGEDTVIPYDGFRKLHETAEKNPNAMVVGVYYIKLSTPMIMVNKNGHITPANVDPGQIFEAWQTGLDAALIPVNLLKKLYDSDPEIPFCVVGNNIGEMPFIGEDNFFVHRWRKMGFKLLVDTDVQCLHMDLQSGKYTAHPDIDLNNYFTQIPLTGRLTMYDKKDIDLRWSSRLPHVENKKLEDIYSTICADTSLNAYEHYPTLKKYAEECNHVTEFGSQFCFSTYALMAGKPQRLISYDIVTVERCGIDRNYLKELASENGVNFDFIEGDTKEIEIEETDLLFIDTHHTYAHLKIELHLHHNKVKKYIILHDTTTFGDIGEDGSMGLWLAVVEFLSENKQWTVHQRFTNNNGLTVLKKE
jgi:hypothetical protein